MKGELGSGEAEPTDHDGPERSCIVTRVKDAPDNLIRFVVGPDLSVVPDIRARLPGRGAWVKAEAAVVTEAVHRKSFARAFKSDVKVRIDLAAWVGSLLEQDALQALSIANKAGLVVTGMVKISAALDARSLIAIIHAADGAADGRRKIEAAIRRAFGETAETLRRVQIFRSCQLDLALGRTNVIHAALAAGRASDGFLSRSRRLDHYRGSQLAAAADATGSTKE